MAGLERTILTPARSFSLLLFGMACWVLQANGQCCGGASKSITDSCNDLFRVEAISLSGARHASHGPYKFRFRTLRLGLNGNTKVLGVFYQAWNDDAHFNNDRLCISNWKRVCFEHYSRKVDPFFLFP